MAPIDEVGTQHVDVVFYTTDIWVKEVRYYAVVNAVNACSNLEIYHAYAILSTMVEAESNETRACHVALGCERKPAQVVASAKAM